MPRELGIKENEVWAYRRSDSEPLIAVRVVDPGTHYDSRIQVQALDTRKDYSVKRSALPCKWEDVGPHLEKRRQKLATLEEAKRLRDLERDQANWDLGAEEAELAEMLPISYSIKNAARATGCSTSTLYNAIYTGDLEARVPPRGRMVVLRTELDRWIRSLAVVAPRT